MARASIARMAGLRRSGCWASTLALSALALAGCGSTTTKTTTVTVTTPAPAASTGPVSASDATTLVGRFEQVFDEGHSPGFNFVLTATVSYRFDTGSTFVSFHDVTDHFEKSFFTGSAHVFTATNVQIADESGTTVATGDYNSPQINGTTGTFKFHIEPPKASGIAGDPCAANPCISAITFQPTGRLG
jgi:hypothetical protein